MNNNIKDYNEYSDSILREKENLASIISPNSVRKDEIITMRASDKEALKAKFDAEGEPKWNNNLIISSLCPFNNVSSIRDDILENIQNPSSFLPLLPSTSRIDNIKAWLNFIWENPKVLDLILVEMPFNRYEVETPTLGIKSNPKFNYIRRDMLYYLDKLYDRLYTDSDIKKLNISSAYRSPEYNALIKYSDFDTHIIGCAVDIIGNEELINKIENYAKVIGFGGIGKGKNIIHLDLNATSRWTY